MQKRPDLQDYFEIGSEFHSTVGEECFKDKIKWIFNQEEIKNFTRDIQDTAADREDEDLYVTSNGYGFISSEMIRKYIPSFAGCVFKPAPIVQETIKNVLQTIGDTKYISLHIRCGDYVIEMPRHGGEKRLDISDANIIEHIMNRAVHVQQTFPNSFIFIHSDSSELKKKMMEYHPHFISYPSVVCHTAEEENVNGGYLSTISEFFFMSQACYIIQLGKYSGFSHIASVYGGTLFTAEETNDIIESFCIH